MAAAASTIGSSSSVSYVKINIEDPNYGRVEYIQDLVKRILAGENVLITLGGFFDAAHLSPVLQTKFGNQGSVFFPGFSGALDEVVKKIQSLNKQVIVDEFRGGSNSDLLGLLGTSNDLDGYFVSLSPTTQSKK
jgi:hypothetical protein